MELLDRNNNPMKIGDLVRDIYAYGDKGILFGVKRVDFSLLLQIYWFGRGTMQGHTEDEWYCDEVFVIASKGA